MTAVGDAPSAGVTPAQTPQSRWHDLDALRGFAMLLGIALHASLSFFPGFWIVLDSEADDNSWFDEFFHAVHGFRMPLFFLLSGFFTTMLWRRRGTSGLVRHRLRRIAVLLAIFALPMGLVMTATVDNAIDAGVTDYIEDNDDIWAAVFLQNDAAVGRLLDDGIDVDAANPEEGGDTPLHVAAFVDNLEIVEMLLDRGADPESVAAGGRPIDYAVFVGGTEVAERLVAGFAIVGTVVDRISASSSATASTALSGLVMWTLIPLTLLPQLLMGDGGDARVFGPDTSTQWIPEWHVLAYYAVFFAFGALLFGRSGRSGRPLVGTIGRTWPILLPLTAVAFVVALDLTFDPSASWTAAAVGQVAYAWLAIVTLMGVFHTVLSKQRRGVRYLSDSAYWLYLAHLPLVILGQTWIRNWELPAIVKVLGLISVVTAVLLLTYQSFVRYTLVGALLNGKRSRSSS